MKRRPGSGTVGALDRRAWDAGLDRLFRSARSRPAQSRAKPSSSRRRRAPSAASSGRSPRSKAAAPLASPADPRSAATHRELGFDACRRLQGRRSCKDLKAACPKGIDVYLRKRRRRGSRYRAAADERLRPHPRLRADLRLQRHRVAAWAEEPRSVLTQRLRMQGFIVFDFANRVLDAISELSGWYAGGQLKVREDVVKAESMPSPTCSICSTPAAITASWC